MTNDIEDFLSKTLSVLDKMEYAKKGWDKSDRSMIINYEMKAYLLEMLTVLGQMNHPKKGWDKSDGLMTMKVEDRAKLLADGWRLLGSHSRPPEGDYADVWTDGDYQSIFYKKDGDF